MKRLIKIILFLTGLFLAAYGALLVALPAFGAEAAGVVTGVQRPLPALQDRLQGKDLYALSYTFSADGPGPAGGFSFRLSDPLRAPAAGDASQVLYIGQVPLLSALSSDTGFTLKNGLMIAFGLLLTKLSMRGKRRRAPALPKAAAKPGALQGTMRAARYCLVCGQKLPATAGFCTFCGVSDPLGKASAENAPAGQKPEAAVPMWAARPTPLKMIQFKRTYISCPGCAARVRPEQRFCQECGAAVKEGNSGAGIAAQPAAAQENDIALPLSAVAMPVDTAAAPAAAGAARAPKKKRKARRAVGVIALALLIAGIGAGFLYRQQIVYAAQKMWYANQWRLAKNKSVDEKQIRDMLGSAAAAMKNGDISAASAYTFPANAGKVKALLEHQPGYMALMASFLSNIKTIRLGEEYTGAYGYSARPAEAVGVYQDNEYSIQLLKIDGVWFINRL